MMRELLHYAEMSRVKEWLFLLLSFAIKDFLEDRQYSNVSEATLRNYRLTLKAFGEFCSEKELINVEEVTPKR